MQAVADKYGKTIAQVALAWSLQEGFLPLPKSVTPSRIASNLDCFDIELDAADLEVLKNVSGLAGGAPNPDGMDFRCKSDSIEVQIEKPCSLTI